MTPQDWRDLASVLDAGDRRTWGTQDAGTAWLGSVLRAMAARCEEIAELRSAEKSATVSSSSEKGLGSGRAHGLR